MVLVDILVEVVILEIIHMVALEHQQVKLLLIQKEQLAAPQKNNVNHANFQEMVNVEHVKVWDMSLVILVRIKFYVQLAVDGKNVFTVMAQDGNKDM